MSGWPERLGAVAAELGAAGLGVRGALPAGAWDAAVAAPFRCARRLPGARVAWVLGAGRELFAAVRAGPDAGAAHPLDAHTARTAEAAARALRAAGARVSVVLGHAAEEGVYPDLVAAAHGAGLGWPSRLGLLLHPERGPWWSVRAALLTDAPLAAGAPLAAPPPCAACDAPCTRACPGAAPGPGGFDVGRCGAVRAREPRCTARCDARRACPVGAAHGYAAGDEAAVMRASHAAVAARATPG